MENNLTTSLSGLNALVCGATSGIGKSTAIEFAELGASVTIYGRNKSKTLDTMSTLNSSKNQNHQYILGDFDNPDEINNGIRKHIKNGNNYDILINNSGGPKGGLILDTEIEDFYPAFNRHLICNHILFKALYNGMKNNKYGRIINIISTSVKQPIEGLGVSNTIRGAVASWAKTLSFEIGKYGITVNNILPGYTNTDRLSALIEAKSINIGTSKELVSNSMKKSVPLNRFGSPEETAKALAFLASPASGYINGVNLAVDGGRLSCL